MSSLSLKTAIVLGAGTMGSGIAQWLAQNDVKVELVDTKLSVATEAHKRVLLSWQKLQEKGKYTSDQIRRFEENLFPMDIANCQTSADILIEAIIEDHAIKTQVFGELDARMAEHTIFASNTSSFLISSLNSKLSPARKKRFLGLHFFNPAPIMKLVEVIKAFETSQELCEQLGQWLNQRGKVSALCQDSPGFIVNRVARNFYGESLRLAGPFAEEERLREIDHVMKEVGGFKMGPFELMDLIGLDINFQVTQSVWQAFFREPRFAPHQLQAKLVESGLLGRKTKQGFYRYE